MSHTLKNDLKELLTCSICLDKLTEPKLLPCSHRFCKICLQREMERSATSGPKPAFPCPLCKRYASLPRGKGEEWIRHFETDYLLKDVLERLDEDTEDTADVCEPHRSRLEIVCFSCKRTGCVRCAWEKHRQCPRIANFKKEAIRVEYLLKHHLQQTENFIRAVNPHVRKLTSVKKSFENQIHYSSKFAEQCIQNKREQFRSERSRLVHLFESYSKETPMPKKLERSISKIMETFLAKLDIDSKCENEMLRLKKTNLQFAENVRKVSRQLERLPDVNEQSRVSQSIIKILQMDKSNMILLGVQSLTDHKEKFYSLGHSVNVTSLNVPITLDGLFTREEQVQLDILEEVRLLEELMGLIKAAGDPRKLRSDMKRLRVPLKCSTKVDDKSWPSLAASDFQHTTSPANSYVQHRPYHDKYNRSYASIAASYGQIHPVTQLTRWVGIDDAHLQSRMHLYSPQRLAYRRHQEKLNDIFFSKTLDDNWLYTNDRQAATEITTINRKEEGGELHAAWYFDIFVIFVIVIALVFCWIFQMMKS